MAHQKKRKTMEVREIRKQLNMTQDGLAQLLNVSRSTVNRWENGKTKPLPIIQDRINELISQKGEQK